eukprot:TRINITY_DN38142_c0_g1_i1.p1 TRINITY_DN38142_c0_g1~~TRINITY_DN38142_c0_g1_i1.p1  ORF type:complete len:178 (+),score=25.78 TRINITY_DN38142_c0_g1_i1:78-611(+)
MSFLQQLNDACQRGDQEINRLVCKVVGEFKQECLARAERGCQSCQYSKGDGFFSRFGPPGGVDSGYVRRFAKLLEEQIKPEFGDSVFIWPKPDYIGCSRQPDLALSIDFPKQAPPVQQIPAKSNVVRQCGICMEELPVIALNPCGHILCTDCAQRFSPGENCPACRQQVQSHQNLFS